MSAQQQSYIKIKNKNDFDILDKYDGRPIKIPAKGSVDVPFHVAAHILGITGLGDLESRSFVNYICQRWGWNTPEYEKDNKHLVLSGNITADIVTYTMVSSDDEDKGLPKSNKNKGKKDAAPDQEEEPENEE
jgi:hypothetical protein